MSQTTKSQAGLASNSYVDVATMSVHESQPSVVIGKTYDKASCLTAGPGGPLPAAVTTPRRPRTTRLLRQPRAPPPPPRRTARPPPRQPPPANGRRPAPAMPRRRPRRRHPHGSARARCRRVAATVGPADQLAAPPTDLSRRPVARGAADGERTPRAPGCHVRASAPADGRGIFLVLRRRKTRINPSYTVLRAGLRRERWYSWRLQRLLLPGPTAGVLSAGSLTGLSAQWRR